MKILKYIIIILCIILVIVLISLAVLKGQSEQYNESVRYNEIYTNSGQENLVDPPIEINYNIGLLEDRNMFFSVENNIKKYLKAVVENKQADIYNFLDEEYINKFGITQENVLQNVENYSVPLEFKARKIYQMENGNSQITSYYVEGYIEQQVNGVIGQEEEYFTTLNYDSFNRTFSIMPFKYMFGNTVNHQKSNNKVDITIEEYTCYMDRVEVKMKIKNNSTVVINASQNAKLYYYEGKETTNIIEKENEQIMPNEEKEVVITFDNEVQTPKSINVLETNIPIIEDQKEKI